MKITNKKVTVVCMAIVSLVASEIAVAQKTNPKLTIQAQTKSNYIQAPLVDEGLYYYRQDGSKVSFLRKKDTYLLRSKSPSSQAASKQAVTRLKNRFQNRVEAVTKHGLGAGANVVKINNPSSLSKLSAASLKAADATIDEMMPVLANEKGQGDVVMLPGITLAFHNGDDINTKIQNIERKYNLKLEQRIKVTGHIYSFSLQNSYLSLHQQLLLVRAIHQESMIKWSRPHLYAKPEKSAFSPNDPLFSQQWHLRNTGQAGGRCDADCDAYEAWDQNDDTTRGEGVVIAIIDDGVQLNHPDLEDNIDSTNDKDFVGNRAACSDTTNIDLNTDAGDLSYDDDASPHVSLGCLDTDQESFDEDNHGTAVAGIAAAVGNNNEGVAGVAYDATILPIRAVSDYGIYAQDGQFGDICSHLAQAIEYAGIHADVLNNSWSLPICSGTELDDAITAVAEGDNSMIAKKRGTKGSPVIFSSGNDASGWLKITVPVSPGTQTFEWRFLRDAFGDNTVNDDTVWLDDITWPDNTTESFEAGLGDLESACTLNVCNEDCSISLCTSSWQINTDSTYVRTGTQSAMADLSNGECDYTYLSTEKQVTAGNMSFWVWVSTETGGQLDRFEFLINGREIISFGDLPTNVNNAVTYPASLSATIDGVIAVGASNDGDLSGNQMAGESAEERAYYSQFGAALDVLAPSGNQHQLITTTDRTGSDGYNTLANPTGGENYTDLFSGTSASAPIVSGIAAAMIAIDDDLTAAEIRTKIRDTADKIGPIAYDNGGAGRNDFYGYGRVNMAKALQSANGDTPTDPAGEASCNGVPDFSIDFAVSIYQPQPTEFCRSVIPDNSELCIPIKAQNNNLAVICL